MRGFFDNYLQGKIPLSCYAEALSQQDLMFPANYIKLRKVENHDIKRIASLVRDHEQLLQWTAFKFFQKGTSLIYNGQEVCDEIEPSLFETGTITWDGQYNISDYITKLASLKKFPLDVNYEVQVNHQTVSVVITYLTNKLESVGVFSFKDKSGKADLPLEDGNYLNQLTEETIVVTDGKVDLSQAPIWVSL